MEGQMDSTQNRPNDQASTTGFAAWLSQQDGATGSLAPLISWVESDPHWPLVGRHKRGFRTHLRASLASPEVMSSLDAAFDVYKSGRTAASPKASQAGARRPPKRALAPDDALAEILQRMTPEELTRLRTVVEDMLDTLTPRERRVLQLRFGLIDGRARTLKEVGDLFKLSRERIRQIETRALKNLRYPS